jgi:hypothetical protein
MSRRCPSCQAANLTIVIVIVLFSSDHGQMVFEQTPASGFEFLHISSCVPLGSTASITFYFNRLVAKMCRKTIGKGVIKVID